MTARLQEGGDPLWGPFIYDGNKRGEPIEHSLGDGDFVKYKFTVAGTGETWTGPMPESFDHPANAKVTIGFAATEQLVKEGDGWVIKAAPQANER